MKYIVYCTRNNKNAKIYIGVHGTEEPYSFDGYLGNGIHTYNKKFRTDTAFRKAVKKYGVSNFTRITLAVCETESEAYKKEIKFVDAAFVKRRDTYNITVGGKGGNGHSQKIRVAKYEMSGSLICVFDSLTEAAKSVHSHPSDLSKCAKGKTKTAKGHQWRFVKDSPVSLIEPVDRGKYRQVTQYSKTGYRKKTYEGIIEAAKAFNCTPNAIAGVCKGRGKTIKGYQWRYTSEATDLIESV